MHLVKHYIKHMFTFYFSYTGKYKDGNWGFPGGTEVKNPPVNSGDTVQALVREDPTCRGATKPVHHNYSRAHELQLLSPQATTTEACMPIACVLQLQQEKTLQWEAHARQRRVAPARHN